MPLYRAKSPIKLLDVTTKGANPRVVTEASEPFELDEAEGTELVAAGAAVRVDTPPAKPAGGTGGAPK